MRYRYTIFITLFICLAFKASAQQVFTIKGVISKNLSGERIASVVISNLRSRDAVESDPVGWFSIKASVGDTLLFSKKDFVPLKIAIINSGDIPVYMEQLINLNEVTITGQTKKQELNDIMGDYRKQGTFYNGKPPVLSFLTSPVTGLYELFGATPNRAKRFAAFSKGEEEATEVDRRYNVTFVKRVTNAPDSVVKKFMLYYKPSFEDLKQWNDYELIKHVRASYDFYDKNEDKTGLEKLNSPPLQPLTPEKKKDATKPTVFEN